MAVYERGLQALQRHDYQSAAQLFQSILGHYPEEKELHERVRLYLKVCERQLGPTDATPRTSEERVYAATVAINKGAYDDGLEQLQRVVRDDPNNDHAQYMLAVVHALRGDREKALFHLQRAIELNPDNRSLARTDPDLELFAHDESFWTVLQTPPGARRDRRVPARHRTTSR